MSTDTETFGGTYPFESNYAPVEGVRLHYVDERPSGKPGAEPVVMLHGNPTWSFLYRHFIPPIVSAGYRAIAPDQIGYGRSETPLDRSRYTLAARIRSFSAFMQTLDLKDATLVMQDWGGPIGLGWAVENPGRVKRLVMMSTWAFCLPGMTDKEMLPPILQLCRKPEIGEALLLAYNFFVEAFLPWALVRKEKITPELMQAYRAPFPDYNSRIPTMAIQDVPIDEGHPSFKTMQHVHEQLGNLNVPTLLIWGRNDNLFSPDFAPDVWKQIYPHAELTLVDRAGHFIQEDAPEDVVRILLDFLIRHP